MTKAGTSLKPRIKNSRALFEWQGNVWWFRPEQLLQYCQQLLESLTSRLELLTSCLCLQLPMKAWMEESSEDGSFQWLSKLDQGHQVRENL